MKKLLQLFGIAALACVTAVTTRSAATAAEAKVPKSATDEKPNYENWPEEVPNGQIGVAKDGSVLIFKGYGARTEEAKYIAVKRSEDGGKTWSKEEKVGDSVKVDGDMSDAGRYPNNNWTHLGNVTVDETTGDIMVFMSTLKTAQKLHRSKDNGKTWYGEREDPTLFDGPPDDYGCKAALARLPYDDRDVLLFCSPGHKDMRHDFTIWVSFDGGKTWPYKKLVKSGPGNYPWMAVGRPGTPSENMVYVLSGKDWCARFNLAWLFSESEDRPTVEK